jgi:agmatinase
MLRAMYIAVLCLSWLVSSLGVTLQEPLKISVDEPWAQKYGPTQDDQPFSGPLSFSHLPYVRCLDSSYAGAALFDIALLGLPFDTAVSYRPGARFGPHAIRAGSRRQRSIRGYTLQWGLNPYAEGSDIVDCGEHVSILFP